MTPQVSTISTKINHSVIANSPFKKAVVESQKKIAKFEDSLVGYAVLAANLDADYVKEIGIH